MNKNITAFTLAEVLIVLTIIGVVSALTIPSLMQKTNDQEIKTALKKAYSELAQANIKLLSDNGGSIKGLCSTYNHKCFKNLYLPYLKYVKSCEAPNNSQCVSSNVLINDWENGSSVILADGTAINFFDYDSNCTMNRSDYETTTACGEVQIDVNGSKLPNVEGKDTFVVELTDKNIRFRHKYANDYFLKN